MGGLEPRCAGGGEIVLGGYQPWIRDVVHGRLNLSDFEFRLRSDPLLALTELDAERYWVGEITIPHSNITVEAPRRPSP